MKRKYIFSTIIICMFGFKGFCQSKVVSSENYNKYAVPMVDNETKELDWSKVEVKPIMLYQPQQGQNPANGSGGGPSVLSVTDNTDIQVFPSTTPQSEQHMTVSKVHPNNIILTSNTTSQGHYISQNGGTTWLNAISSNSLPDGAANAGDPTSATDANGSLFMETINSAFSGYRFYSSANQGNTWGTAVQYTYNSTNFDKEMMASDNLIFSPYVGNVYTAWTDFGASTTVRFNRSVNNGASFLANITLHSGMGQGTNVQVGENSQVYVCWANYSSGNLPADGMGFTRSFDGGATFSDLTPVFSYTGIRTSNTGNSLFNNTRVNDFPSMAVDKSCIGYRGRIYITYAAKQNGNGKAVILVRTSDDQGTTWSTAIEASISNGRQNWFPWVAVDDATGTVSVAYLSLDQATGFTTNTYLAYSTDGGSTWGNIKVSDVGHTVAPISGFASGYCGDYIANSAWGNKNYVAWNDDRTGQWQNYVSRVDFSQFALFSSSLNMNLNGPVDHTLPTATTVTYNCASNITCPATSTFTIESGANVSMLASGTIIFSPGFTSMTGSNFHASIGSTSGCVNGMARDEISEEMDDQNNELMIPAYRGDASEQFSFYPNPAMNEINITYLLPDKSDVTLLLMDLQGKEIKRLIDQKDQAPGFSKLKYNISDLSGGLYMYKLITTSYTKTGKFSKVN